MQIRLLTTINYGNIGAYSDKMLHTPNLCTRLPAGFYRGDSQASATLAGRWGRGRGYYGAFCRALPSWMQKGLRGLESGDCALDQNSPLWTTLTPPDFARWQRAGQDLSFQGTQEAHLSPPPNTRVLPTAGESLSL